MVSKPTVEENEFFDVVISHVSSVVDFYVQRRTVTDDLVDLQDRLNIVYSLVETTNELSMEAKHHTPGAICAARFDKDDTWYRAFFVKRVSPTQAEVKFVDYGNTDRVLVGGLKHLLMMLRQLPQVAIPCKLTGLIPFTDSAEMTDRFNQAIKDKDVVAHVDSYVDEVAQVTLYEVEKQSGREVNINQALQEFWDNSDKSEVHSSNASESNVNGTLDTVLNAIGSLKMFHNGKSESGANNSVVPSSSAVRPSLLATRRSPPISGSQPNHPLRFRPRAPAAQCLTVSPSASSDCSPSSVRSLPNGYFEVVVTCVDSLLQFYVHTMEAHSQFKQLTQRLTERYQTSNSHKTGFLKCLKTGQLSGYYSPDSGAWRRVKVVSLGQLSGEVILIDTGETRAADFTDLVPLPADLESVPPLAVAVALVGFSHLNQAAYEKRFSDLVKPWQHFSASMQELNDEVSVIELFDLQSRQSITNLLKDVSCSSDQIVGDEFVVLPKDQCHVTDHEISFEQITDQEEHSNSPIKAPLAHKKDSDLYTLDIFGKRVRLCFDDASTLITDPTSEPLINITAIQTGHRHFYIVPICVFHALAEYKEGMDKDYNAQMAPLPAQFVKPNVSGVVCYAEDQTWCRAEVEHVSRRDLTVRLVDYGNCETVNYNDFKPLFSKYRGPPLAYRCRLYGVPDSFAEDCDVFSKVLMDAGVPIRCRFKNVGEVELSGYYLVSLFNSRTNQDLAAAYLAALAKK